MGKNIFKFFTINSIFKGSFREFLPPQCWHNWEQVIIINDTLPYILESNPHPNLIRTSFCRFLKQKKC